MLVIVLVVIEWWCVIFNMGGRVGKEELGRKSWGGRENVKFYFCFVCFFFFGREKKKKKNERKEREREREQKKLDTGAHGGGKRESGGRDGRTKKGETQTTKAASKRNDDEEEETSPQLLLAPFLALPHIFFFLFSPFVLPPSFLFLKFFFLK